MSSIATQSSSNSYKQTLAGSGVVASDGTVEIEFPEAPSGSYATGSCTIYDAPQSASWQIQINGVTVDKALGAASTAGLQIGPQDKLAYLGTGLTTIAGSTLHGSFNAIISPEYDTQLLAPGHDPLVITQDATIQSNQLASGSSKTITSGGPQTVGIFNVGNAAYVIITDSWNLDNTGIANIAYFTNTPNSILGQIGPTFEWGRAALNATVPHQMIIPVLGNYLVYQAQSGSNNTLTYSINTVPTLVPLEILNPPITVIGAGVNGNTIAGGAQQQLFPSQYQGAGKYHVAFAFGSTGSSFPNLPITDQAAIAAIPASAGNTTVLAAPAAGFQNRIKAYEFHANTTAFTSTFTYTLFINGQNVDVQYYQATGLVGQGDIDLRTTTSVVLSNSGTSAGQAVVHYDVEPIPLVARVATAIQGNGNPQLYGDYIIDAYNNEFDFIAPTDDWFIYVTNQSGSSINYSCTVVGPY